MTIMASVEVLDLSPRRAESTGTNGARPVGERPRDGSASSSATLLEIIRYDTSGGALARTTSASSSSSRGWPRTPTPHVPVIYPPEMETTVVLADKRRLARVIANLLDNASTTAAALPRSSYARSGSRRDRGGGQRARASRRRAPADLQPLRARLRRRSPRRGNRHGPRLGPCGRTCPPSWRSRARRRPPDGSPAPASWSSYLS